MSSASPAPASPPAQKICFNSHCKDPAARRLGWRLRSGEIVALCDRCSCAYEQGSFCEAFHSEIPGWRNCETCGKRVHCGCIVSASAYVFLDAGGVDCIVCAKKSPTMVTNQMMASPVLMQQNTTERRNAAAKSWRPSNGLFPGQWRQTPHMWNLTSAQSDLQQRLSYEFDRPNNIEKLIPGVRHSISAHEKKFEELPDKLALNSIGTVPRDRFINGTTSSEPVTFGAFHREDVNGDCLHDPKQRSVVHDSSSARRSMIPDPSSTSSSAANQSLIVNPQSPSIIKEEPTTLLTGLVASFPSTSGSRDARFPLNLPQSQASSSSAKQFFTQGAVDAELHTQMLNGRPRFDCRARAPMLPRYWPRITGQEREQISGDTNSVITPLFEKMLSASDAGRIGRLVLPKKCAEAYFPTISHPEGLPLKVQDASGKEWVFQFRFWPNNNSRMYVLEGVTTCIQSMQLQAGDTVTFSRIDPEGKLMMGFRKASTASSEQEFQKIKSGNGLSTSPEGANKSPVLDLGANVPLQITKPSIEPNGTITTPDQASWSKTPGADFIQKDGSGAKLSHNPSKRKISAPGSKIKRLRIEKEDSMELKVTWEEAQELLRPAPNSAPTVVNIEGYEFEEYEHAPIIGKRTYFIMNRNGNMCSSAEELNLEQLADLINSEAGASKRSKVKVEKEITEFSDGLDTLANLAILGEGENLTSLQSTKHPRHRPGCTCIVCIQPPSGKVPKHKQNCMCNVCLTVKRRFRTLMLRREKRQSEKDAVKAENSEKNEDSKKQQQLSTSLDQPHQAGSNPSSIGQGVNSSQTTLTSNSSAIDEGSDQKRISLSPLKAPQIDLNIQPEREEEPSPNADNGSMASLLQNATT